jgi:hypothetical protein
MKIESITLQNVVRSLDVQCNQCCHRVSVDVDHLLGRDFAIASTLFHRTTMPVKVGR